MPVTNYSDKKGPTERHTKEDALSAREFERLLEGAGRLKDYYEREAELILLVCGRLGLRRGEVAHLHESWIDHTEQTITIPRHDPCTKGDDGGICGYCANRIRGIIDYNDGVDHIPESEFWQPKTENAAREVYYGWSPRTALHIDRFFGKYDEWPYSCQAINRRVTKAAEHTEGMNPDEVYPHALRATAASHLAGRGLGTLPLLQIMGWEQLGTAERYISRSGQHTAQELRKLNSL